MEKNLNRIFVYGSLRSGFHNPAYEYISKYFKLLGEGKVKGRMYDMGSFPAAVPAEEGFIKGELYEHNGTGDFGYTIEQLDAYEGVNPEEGEPLLYRREKVEVEYENGRSEAWIYWFSGQVDDQPVIASGDVFDFIHQKSKF